MVQNRQGQTKRARPKKEKGSRKDLADLIGKSRSIWIRLDVRVLTTGNPCRYVATYFLGASFSWTL